MLSQRESKKLLKKKIVNNPRSNQWEGKKNPFVEELGDNKVDDADSTQLSYTETGSGWLPFYTAKNNLKAMFDNTQVPGHQDSSQSWGGPWSAMGEPPQRGTKREVRKYENILDMTKDKATPEIYRDPKEKILSERERKELTKKDPKV